MKLVLILILLSGSLLVKGLEPSAVVPNCKPVKGNFLFASTTEVSNGDYLFFLNDQLKKLDSEDYKELLPDTSAWLHKLTYYEPYETYYFRHPAYRNYPVVNISRYQAEAFCEWLEVQLNLRFSRIVNQPFVAVDVRLPTDQEWQEAARGGDENAIFPWPGYGMRNTTTKNSGKFMANFMRARGDYMGVAGHLNDGADITAPVRSYWPNSFGLYNMSGNVAEMLQEEGRTRGGSWASRAPYLEIAGIDPFQGFLNPSPEIGFRYFVEVIDTRDCERVRKKKVTAKRIEQLLVSVTADTLLAGKFEVSNEWYAIFVEETNSDNQPNDELWIGKLPYARRFKNDYSTHSAYKNHPVVNITRNQALLFCKWLEEKYNSFPKRRYEHLRFDLPTEMEWENMASAKNNSSLFPWGGPYAMNSKGDWLCNYNTVQERWVVDLNDSTYLLNNISHERVRAAAGQDGALITAPVDAYCENELGIKNVCGNVAEMVVDRNIAKGGSWGSMIYEVGVKNSQVFTTASPFVGFRIIARP